MVFCFSTAARHLRNRLLAALSLAATAAAASAVEAQPVAAPLRLHVVGGLAGINQYVRHEEPFWTRELPRLSGGRITAEIVPFDRAGIRGQERLRLLEAGAVPFGTVMLDLNPVQDPELSTSDLEVANPDMATLRRSTAAFRPYLERLLWSRYGVELLAVYTYPAQVLFCRQPITGLADLKGRRVRTSNPSQSDVVEATGGTPVPIPFAELVANASHGSIDCAITGSMSGNSIGLHEVMGYLLDLPLGWGVAAFVANGAAWSALPSDARQTLQRELPRLEDRIWQEADRESVVGIACNIGAAACVDGRRGRMQVVRPGAETLERRRQLLLGTVLPRWFQRCGPGCVDAWRETVGPEIGVSPR